MCLWTPSPLPLLHPSPRPSLPKGRAIDTRLPRRIATQIPDVYVGLTLPMSVRQLLARFQIAVTLGFSDELLVGPLKCLGGDGYASQLLAYILAPLVPVALVILVYAARASREGPNTVQPAGCAALIWRCADGIGDVLIRSAPFALRIAFFAYPFVSRKAFAVFSCHDFGVEVGKWLVADVGLQCGSPEHESAKHLALFGICLYPVGLLLMNAALLFCARRSIRRGLPSMLADAIAFLHHEFQPQFFWWELCEMVRRFFLVGVMVVVKPGSLGQLSLATLFSFLYLVVQLQAAPYAKVFDNYVALVASIGLVGIFLCAVIFKMERLADLPAVIRILPDQVHAQFEVPADQLTIILFASILGAIILTGLLLVIQVAQERERQRIARRDALARRLRVEDTDELVLLPELPRGSYHLFLSHVWRTGQDPMRIVKERLLQMIVNARVFLDVDDLSSGRGSEFVDRSSLILVFATDGYFGSVNCMRELLRAVLMRKPIFTLVETEDKAGRLTRQQVREQLVRACQRFREWGLLAEVEEWVQAGKLPPGVTTIPTADVLYASLFPPGTVAIEWNRIGAFQDVSMRAIAQRLLETDRRQRGHQLFGFTRSLRRTGSATRLPSYFVQGELAHEKPQKRSPRMGCASHCYVAPGNPGARELIDEVSANFPWLALSYTQDLTQLSRCEHLLLYLNKQTWTRGDASEALADEVIAAFEQGVHVMLAWEAIGEGQEARGGVKFEMMFACDAGATPERLLQRDVYREIALTLKGGPFRYTSLVALAKALTKRDHLPEFSSSSRRRSLSNASSQHTHNQSQRLSASTRMSRCESGRRWSRRSSNAARDAIATTSANLGQSGKLSNPASWREPDASAERQVSRDLSSAAAGAAASAASAAQPHGHTKTVSRPSIVIPTEGMLPTELQDGMLQDGGATPPDSLATTPTSLAHSETPERTSPRRDARRAGSPPRQEGGPPGYAIACVLAAAARPREPRRLSRKVASCRALFAFGGAGRSQRDVSDAARQMDAAATSCRAFPADRETPDLESGSVLATSAAPDAVISTGQSWWLTMRRRFSEGGDSRSSGSVHALSESLPSLASSPTRLTEDELPSETSPARAQMEMAVLQHLQGGLMRARAARARWPDEEGALRRSSSRPSPSMLINSTTGRASNHSSPPSASPDESEMLEI